MSIPSHSVAVFILDLRPHDCYKKIYFFFVCSWYPQRSEERVDHLELEIQLIVTLHLGTGH